MQLTKHLNNAITLSELYDRYSSSIFGLIQRSIPDKKVAENILEEVFEKFSAEFADVAHPYKKPFTVLFCICKETLKNFESNTADDVVRELINKKILAPR